LLIGCVVEGPGCVSESGTAGDEGKLHDGAEVGGNVGCGCTVAVTVSEDDDVELGRCEELVLVVAGAGEEDEPLEKCRVPLTGGGGNGPCAAEGPACDGNGTVVVPFGAAAAKNWASGFDSGVFAVPAVRVGAR